MGNRILPKGAEKKASVCDPNGEQLVPSADLMEQIAKGEGYDNVNVVRLKQAILDGTCAEAGMDVEKLKSEKWNETDKLVASSQKAGAILLGLHLAKKEGEKFPDKKHII